MDKIFWFIALILEQHFYERLKVLGEVEQNLWGLQNVLVGNF
jgi:hypothetical protein